MELNTRFDILANPARFCSASTRRTAALNSGTSASSSRSLTKRVIWSHIICFGSSRASSRMTENSSVYGTISSSTSFPAAASVAGCSSPSFKSFPPSSSATPSSSVVRKRLAAFSAPSTVPFSSSFEDDSSCIAACSSVSFASASFRAIVLQSILYLQASLF